MDPLNLVKLTTLMERSSGSPNVKIGLVDGPVATDLPELASVHLHELNGDSGATCTVTSSMACLHGTFVAGILAAARSSFAPAICPDCTLIVRPIFSETSSTDRWMPSATAGELAGAIVDCVDAGARVINLSLALARPSPNGDRMLQEVLDGAARRGVILVAAAGNQGTLGSTTITRHPWVIPVVACDRQGRAINMSNLGSSIGRRGLCAPGERITSLSPAGEPLTFDGTSVAVPFVTGAIALLWSLVPDATATQIRFAITQASGVRRAVIVPPVMDAAASYLILSTTTNGRRIT